jgi:hypothetical protein
LSNIYLNEFDRYIVHELRPLAYLRYGDDWLCFARTEQELRIIQRQATQFLRDVLMLTLSPKLNMVQPVYRGVTFLGVDMWSNGRRITCETRRRIEQKLSPVNYPSYDALVRAFSNDDTIKKFYWDSTEV